MKIDNRFLAVGVALLTAPVVFSIWTTTAVAKTILQMHATDAELVRRFDQLYAELKNGKIEIRPSSEAQKVRRAVRIASFGTQSYAAVIREWIEAEQRLYREALTFFLLQLLLAFLSFLPQRRARSESSRAT